MNHLSYFRNSGLKIRAYNILELGAMYLLRKKLLSEKLVKLYKFVQNSSDI